MEKYQYREYEYQKSLNKLNNDRLTDWADNIHTWWGSTTGTGVVYTTRTI